MDIPVQLPGMEGQTVALRLAGAFTGAQLVLNGRALPKRKGLVQLRSNAGSTLAVKSKIDSLIPSPI